jgi:hypothetical protein
MRPKKIVFFAALLLALAGCNTIDHRINEKQAVFDRLDPQTQFRIRQGMIAVGYTEDMVYMALGRPDAVRQRTTAKGDETTWIYNTYDEEYEGVAPAGYRRIVFFDPGSREYHVVYEPVNAPVYSEHVEDNIRVTFANGRVAAIEQKK